MIRFIDIGKQVGVDDEEWHREFSFWDTITNKYIELDGKQMWDCWEDFKNDHARQKDFPYGLIRFYRLCPPWVFEYGFLQDDFS